MNINSNKYLSINIRSDIFQKIAEIAEKKFIQSELLINCILEQYIQEVLIPSQTSPDVTFLLSMAGMFNTKEQDTSERVHEIVRACVETKNGFSYYYS